MSTEYSLHRFRDNRFADCIPNDFVIEWVNDKHPQQICLNNITISTSGSFLTIGMTTYDVNGNLMLTSLIGAYIGGNPFDYKLLAHNFSKVYPDYHGSESIKLCFSSNNQTIKV